jgi:hypothetical protein
LNGTNDSTTFAAAAGIWKCNTAQGCPGPSTLSSTSCMPTPTSTVSTPPTPAPPHSDTPTLRVAVCVRCVIPGITVEFLIRARRNFNLHGETAVFTSRGKGSAFAFKVLTKPLCTRYTFTNRLDT